MNEELFKSAVVMAAPLIAQAAYKGKTTLGQDAIHNYVVNAYTQLEKAQATIRAQTSATPHTGSTPSPA